MGIITTCAIAAAMVLFWNWRLSLLGLILVQFGATAVALNTQRVDSNVMLVQICVMILCGLILALSMYQAPQSPSIRQSGNWFLRLLALLLLYFALRLSEFDFVLPLPDLDPSEALRLTIFFAWLCICALLTLSFSDNPLFTGIALLLWCVPAHLLAAILTPVSGIVVLIGIIELLLALACSYLILMEGLSTEARPIVATDVTFPMQDQRLLTDRAMVPIGEMTTIDIPSVSTTPQDRAALAGKTLPTTAPRGTVIAPQTPLPRSTSARSTEPPSNPPRESQPSTSRRPVRTRTPLTRTNLRPVQKPPKPSVSPSVPPDPANRPRTIPNQVRNEQATDMEATRPTPNIFGEPADPAKQKEPTAPDANGMANQNDARPDHHQESDDQPLLARK